MEFEHHIAYLMTNVAQLRSRSGEHLTCEFYFSINIEEVVLCAMAMTMNAMRVSQFSQIESRDARS